MLDVLTLLAALAISPPAQDTGRIERDVAYVPGGGHRQQLDLYLPAGRGFPTVLLIHGGSLTTGDRTEEPYASACLPFRAAGIGCAAMSYRLLPGDRWPAPALDAAAAYDWLVRSLPARGGAPSRVFLVGHSSGCLLASLLATDPKYLRDINRSPAELPGVVAMGCRLANEPDTAGVPPERIRAAFASHPDYMGFGSLETLFDIVPLGHVGPGMPRMLVLIAETEQEQPPILADARRFEEAAKKVGAPVEIVILPGRTHMSSVARLGEPDDLAFRRIRELIAGADRR